MQEKMYLANRKTEHGDGGISYAMYFVAMIICLVLFVFFIFNANLYIIEETMENGLHIAETRVLTVNQDGILEDGTRADEFERETARMHIVTKYNVTSRTTEEENQVRLFGKAFSESIKEQLKLNGSKPSGDILKHMCGSDADILITELRIFEPVYSRTVTKAATGKIGGTNLDTFKFTTNYTVDNWIVYELNFDADNNYVSFTKTVKTGADVPTLARGDVAEGATIEASLATNFSGIRNIFAGVNTTPPTINEGAIDLGDGLRGDEISLEGTGGGMFSDNPVAQQYDVIVTQSVDIVIAEQDSRKQ